MVPSYNANVSSTQDQGVPFFSFFFYLGFLPRTLTNHRTAGKGGGLFLNSSSDTTFTRHTDT